MTSELVTKSSIIYSERRGAVYKENDEITLYIPPSYSIIDTKNTYVSMRVKCTGNMKCCPSGMAGPYSMWRNLEISDGTGTHVLESLQQYGQFQSLVNFYSENESKRNLRVLHEGLPMRTTLTDATGLANQYINANASSSDVFGQVECLMPIHLSGIMSPDRSTVWPNVATNGLRMRFNLNDAHTALQCMKAPTYKQNGEPDGGSGGYDSTHAYELHADAAQGATELVLKCVADEPTQDGRCLSADYQLAGHLFMVGQNIELDGNNQNQTKITGVSVSRDNDDEPYRITLTVTPIELAAGAGASCYILTEASTTDINFEISDFRLITSYVIPPPKYLQSVMGAVGKGLSLDIKTYQLYQTNIASGTNQASIFINARNNRAKSIISIPYKANAGESVTEDSMMPDRGPIRDYQMILYKVLTPSKRVDCSRFNNNSFNAECLREQDLALSAADISVENLFKNQDMFFIGRRLAQAGFSYNCNKPQEGEIRLNVSYSDGNEATLMHNYIVHLRRIQVSSAGMQIVY